ncbi:MAG TPA: precorrin-3B synthase, partial [Acetobacteraceae bacterium]|nr:precorrin-3B synthase [Acetobacteraceae bacterium]
MTDNSMSPPATMLVPVIASAAKQSTRLYAAGLRSPRFAGDDAMDSRGPPPVLGGGVHSENQRREVAGWCPGVLRPMRSGDGLIVRLKIGGGIVDARLAARIANWSHRWGNGQIDLSGRGNLQLRGLAAQNLEALRDAVAEAGLLDPSADGEAVRNVVSSPLAGLDPGAVLDVRPIARALERRLSLDATLHGLPAKFGFVIDDGGTLGLDDVAADIRFKARSGPDGPGFAIGLAGSLQTLPGACRPEDLVDVAVVLSFAFLGARRGRETSIRRMRDLVAADGSEVIGRAAGLGQNFTIDCTPPRETFGPNRSDDETPAVSTVLPQLAAVLPGLTALPEAASVVILGLDPRTSPDPRTVGLAGPVAPLSDAATTAPVPPGNAPTTITFLGVGLPLGRIAAADLAVLAAAAETVGAHELRLTPWRMIVVPVRSPQAAHALLARLPITGFILHPGDPRRRIAACPGAPSCARGTTPVRDDATVLAKVLGSSEVLGSGGSTTAGGQGIVVHVSGCEKGCAHPRKAKLTLVAQNGRYQLVRDGSASDVPVERDLTVDQAAVHLVANFARGAPASDAAALAAAGLGNAVPGEQEFGEAETDTAGAGAARSG